tara:strand:+ start:2790 stop:2963 length:174 start_codon:yes stop_codon:yes gene_type:complete
MRCIFARSVRPVWADGLAAIRASIALAAPLNGLGQLVPCGVVTARGDHRALRTGLSA